MPRHDRCTRSLKKIPIFKLIFEAENQKIAILELNIIKLNNINSDNNQKTKKLLLLEIATFDLTNIGYTRVSTDVILVAETPLSRGIDKPTWRKN